MNDYQTLYEIHKLLDYEEWDAGTIEEVAHLIEKAGWEIHGPDDLRTTPISQDLIEVGEPFEWGNIGCHYYGVYIAKGVRVTIWDAPKDESIVKMQVVDDNLKNEDGTKDYENSTRRVQLPYMPMRCASLPLLEELAATVKGARG